MQFRPTLLAGPARSPRASSAITRSRVGERGVTHRPPLPSSRTVSPYDPRGKVQRRRSRAACRQRLPRCLARGAWLAWVLRGSGTLIRRVARIPGPENPSVDWHRHLSDAAFGPRTFHWLAEAREGVVGALLAVQEVFATARVRVGPRCVSEAKLKRTATQVGSCHGGGIGRRWVTSARLGAFS